MRDVKLVRLSEDGTHLVLAHEGTGEEFALRIDDRVRGAVVSDRARLGQLPMERPSRLRPKEIQARLRGGESSEDIASAADVPLERILRYAGPVLAERAYISEQARRCVLRRAGGEGAGKPLEDLVGQRLTAFGSDPDKADWDAWRAPDGRWAVSVTYNLDGEDQSAVFSFDPLGRVVLPSDDAAHAIIEGPKVDGPAPRTPRDRLRLAPAPAEPQVEPVGEPFGEPFVESVGPERTERQADVRPLRPATTLASRVREEAGTPDDIDVDSEDTIDLSRALDRREPISAPDELPDLDDEPVSEQVPEHVPEPVYEPEPAPVPEAPKPAAPKPAAPKPSPPEPAAPKPAPPPEAKPIETEPAATVEPEPIQPELTPAEPEPAPAARTKPEPAPAAEPEAEPEPEEEHAKPVRRQRPADAAARKRRASRSSRKGNVPSWDDILFGNSRGKD